MFLKKIRKKVHRIVRFCKHLWNAVRGLDPFAKEVGELIEGYNSAVETQKSLEQRAVNAELALKKTNEFLVGFQTLTENLRQRVADKEELVEQVRKERADERERYKKAVEAMRFQHSQERAVLEQRLAETKEDLNATLQQLQHANSSLGKDIMAQSLLEKTNNGLEDLYAAMQRGDTEAMMEITQGLDWSNHLTRIAQQHLMVLKRKNELEARLYERRFDTEG